MNIDWSKAPEGTEAYCCGYWLKRDSNEDNSSLFLCQPTNNGWEPVGFKPWKQSGFVYKSDDLAYQEDMHC